jgi:hypothetical protein
METIMTIRKTGSGQIIGAEQEAEAEWEKTATGVTPSPEDVQKYEEERVRGTEQNDDEE